MRKDRDPSFDAFRAVAIIAVVAIHTVRCGLPETYSQTGRFNFLFLVGWQQLFNFAVPVFLFISGYWLAKKPFKSFQDYKTFLVKRLSRIFVPYLFWSLVFCGYAAVKAHEINAYEVIIKLLTGQAAWGYYFIIVIAQLYILTPLLQYINRRTSGLILVLVLNIISLLALYLSRVFGVIRHLPAALPFYSWIIFYETGLFIASRDDKTFATPKMRPFILPAILICLLISELEGMILLLKYDNLEFAITSIKYSSFLYSACVISAFLFVRGRIEYWPKILVKAGEYSFGIYLMHMLVLDRVAAVARRISTIYSFQPLYQFIVVSVTFSACYAVISITRRLLPASICRRILGF